MCNELIWNGPVLRRRIFIGQPKLERRDQDIQLGDGLDLKEKILAHYYIILSLLLLLLQCDRDYVRNW